MRSVITAIHKVSDKQKDRMYALFDRFYCNSGKSSFLRDLNDKDWVILLENETGITGFSTLKIFRLTINNQDTVFLFSGDTIVDPRYWRDSKLAGSFGHFMLRLISENKDLPIFWFLISKGYRTYRFLPVFFNRYYPVHDQETPDNYQNILNEIARFKFNGRYDPEHGLVRHNGVKDCLRPELCSIPNGKLQDPHVQYFLNKNPNYHRGDELACIADITPDNLNRYAWRVIHNVTVDWDE